LKVKLFVLSALVLLSSINGIFFNNPIGVSAQEYENVDDYIPAGINEMVEDYSNGDPGMYNADNGYSSSIDSDINQQDNSEYSTSNNSYEPTQDYGAISSKDTEYSSYDNYEYSSNNEYSQDEYSDKSYGGNDYPPKEPKKFTCPDSGIVVDKEENCPLVCPAGTDLEGHLIAAGSNLQVVCDEDAAAQFETCGTGTDLAGVLVANAPEDCNIFATCDASDPLGQALGLSPTQTVEVADEQLCQLEVPAPVEIFQCPTEATTEVPFLNPALAGANVTDIALCSVATPAVQCEEGSTLQGVWVHPDDTETCDLVIPPPPTPPLVTNLQAQCLKCADLAVFAATPANVNNLATAAAELRGSTTSNIFTVCDDTNPRTGFNALITNAAVETAFDTCLDNAGVNPGNGTSTLAALQPQSLSLQEMSFTTNALPEAGISTFSSPPARGTEDLSALDKIAKLKEQWMELTP